jgi:hypothetical protein
VCDLRSKIKCKTSTKCVSTKILTYILYNFWLAEFTFAWFAVADLFLLQLHLKRALRHTNSATDMPPHSSELRISEMSGTNGFSRAYYTLNTESTLSHTLLSSWLAAHILSTYSPLTQTCTPHA